MKKLPTWKAIAKAFNDAFRECDWSFGRVQDARIHDALGAAQSDFEDKSRQRRQKRRRA